MGTKVNRAAPALLAARRPYRLVARALLAAAMLVVVLSVPAAALALSGASGSGSAAAAQYSRAYVSSDPLPYTGYLLIAVIPIALVMLSLGLVLRRRAQARR